MTEIIALAVPMPKNSRRESDVSLFTEIVDLNAFLVWNLGPFRRTEPEVLAHDGWKK